MGYRHALLEERGAGPSGVEDCLVAREGLVLAFGSGGVQTPRDTGKRLICRHSSGIPHA